MSSSNLIIDDLSMRLLNLNLSAFALRESDFAINRFWMNEILSSEHLFECANSNLTI